MKYIGVPTPIEDAVMKVTGHALYTDDLFFPNALTGKILFSPHAHARIRAIDTSAAEELPGVYAVVCCKDAPNVPYNRIHRHLHDTPPARELMFDTHLRSIADPVAAVAAENETIARHALSLIRVEYDMLPCVLDPERALDENAPKLYPEGNLLEPLLLKCGDVDAAIQEADVVATQRMETKMIHHAAIEPHVCVAYWAPDNNLSIWGPQQGVHRTQLILSRIFGLPVSNIHYHGMLMGGAFGGKDGVTAEHIAALLSKKTGRYVKIHYTRKESIFCATTRHPARMETTIAAKRDGTVTAIDYRQFMNVGAYCGGSINVHHAMCGKMFKVYSVPNMRFDGKAVYTNTPVGGAMRGFGSPKVFTAIEAAMDKLAKALDMDPLALRVKNAISPYDADPVNGLSLANGRLKDCLLKGAELFEWEKKKQACALLCDSRYAYGTGLAAAMHGNGVAPFAPDISVASLEMNEDGTCVLRTGSCDHGAGTYTLYKMIVAELLDLPLDAVNLIHSDTDAGTYDTGAGASRNTWTGGQTVALVAEQMRSRLLQLAAEALQAPLDGIVLQGDHFVAPSENKFINKTELVWYAMDKRREKLIETLSYNSYYNAGSYGAHFAQVRVDRRTGEVKVLDYVAACDVGTALNPLLLEGQVEGAIAMGLGMALYEEIELDEKGLGKSTTFKRYRIPHASDMPPIRIRFVEAYEEHGPFGGKSIGEAAIVPVAPAIINAVNNALGTELTDLPLRPEKVLAALRG